MSKKEENERLSDFDILLNDVRGIHSRRVNAALLIMDEEDFMVNYFKILEYTSPKLQRREIIEEERDNTIVIEHTFRKEDEV